MTRQQIESAVARGVPFSLLMADGREYRIPHPDYISLPPKAAYVIVYDDVGHFTVLPLLAMTGLQSSITDASTKKKEVRGKASRGETLGGIVYPPSS